MKGEKGTILVTGGAGYIGSHAVRALCDEGFDVVVLDNLSKGKAELIDERATFVHLDLADRVGLKELFEEFAIDAIMHFAGSIEAGLSMQQPAEFLENNVMNGEYLLEAMREAGVKRIIFSSTAAVYGDPKEIPITEDAALEPTNFYGVTKLMFEQILRKYDEYWNFRFVALRYFNAAGAVASGEIGEMHEPETHLIPLTLKAHASGGRLKIFGTDYDTKDGTCVRDYIHVTDLVDAHVLALRYLLDGGKSDIFNLGNGNGFTVREVIETASDVVEEEIPFDEVERRVGDPAVLVADSTKARKVLGWQPKLSSLEEIIRSAWNWHSK